MNSESETHPSQKLHEQGPNFGTPRNEESLKVMAASWGIGPIAESLASSPIAEGRTLRWAADSYLSHRTHTETRDTNNEF